MTNLIATDVQGTTVDSGVVSLFEITLLHSGNTFYFCEGIGARRTNANFRSVVEKYLNWFNPETVDFFTGICKCSNIIKERKYPKWRLEDKFEFDEYTLHIAEQAGAEVRTKAENNK